MTKSVNNVSILTVSVLTIFFFFFRMLLEIYYSIISINGDYAYCMSDNGSYTNIALALLPDDINEGDRIRFYNFTYEKVDND